MKHRDTTIFLACATVVFREMSSTIPMNCRRMVRGTAAQHQQTSSGNNAGCFLKQHCIQNNLRKCYRTSCTEVVAYKQYYLDYGDTQLVKKKLNASEPSEHPPSGENLFKVLGGNISFREISSYWY